jgi:hypothetical protein
VKLKNLNGDSSVSNMVNSKASFGVAIRG